VEQLRNVRIGNPVEAKLHHVGAGGRVSRRHQFRRRRSGHRLAEQRKVHQKQKRPFNPWAEEAFGSAEFVLES
jgi:hypothetical protein